MRYLIAFLVRKRVFILFLLLEGVALYWIIESRSYQRSVFLDSSTQLTGSILDRYNNLTQYLDLKKQNDRLARENARLRTLLKDSYHIITQSQNSDTIYQTRYTYIKANVLNSSYSKRRNYITINRGRKHGVQPEMGIIGPEGAIGIVSGVSKNFATVIPLINPTLTVSGRFKNKGYFGPLNWPGADYRYTSISDIPRYAKINKGDTVETDARSLIFPPGIPLGTVDTLRLQADRNFYEVDLKLAADFSSLEEVYVVIDKMKVEVENLEIESLTD